MQIEFILSLDVWFSWKAEMKQSWLRCLFDLRSLLLSSPTPNKKKKKKNAPAWRKVDEKS